MITVAAAVSGLLFLDKGYRIRKTASDTRRAKLAALEIARPDLSAERRGNLDFLTGFDAGSYYSAVDAFGSFAFTESELASGSESNRIAADAMLASPLDLRLGEVSGSDRSASSRRRCQRIGGKSETSHGVPLEPGLISVKGNGAPASLLLARFSDVPSVRLRSVGNRQVRALNIPRDLSTRQ